MKAVSKLKDDARKHELREEWEKAVQVYLQVLSMGEQGEGEMELPLYNRVGDLYVRLGRAQEAVRYYEQAADRYAEAGLYNNAIALCNKAMRYHPNHIGLLRKLGVFSALQGFHADARRYILDYFDKQVAQGKIEDGLNALTDFARIADDADARELLGRKLQEHGRSSEALVELRAAQAMAAAAGQVERAAALRAEIQRIDGSAAPESFEAETPTTAAEIDDLSDFDVTAQPLETLPLAEGADATEDSAFAPIDIEGFDTADIAEADQGTVEGLEDHLHYSLEMPDVVPEDLTGFFDDEAVGAQDDIAFELPLLAGTEDLGRDQEDADSASGFEIVDPVQDDAASFDDLSLTSDEIGLLPGTPEPEEPLGLDDFDLSDFDMPETTEREPSRFGLIPTEDSEGLPKLDIASFEEAAAPPTWEAEPTSLDFVDPLDTESTFVEREEETTLEFEGMSELGLLDTDADVAAAGPTGARGGLAGWPEDADDVVVPTGDDLSQASTEALPISGDEDTLAGFDLEDVQAWEDEAASASAEMELAAAPDAIADELIDDWSLPATEEPEPAAETESDAEYVGDWASPGADVEEPTAETDAETWADAEARLAQDSLETETETWPETPLETEEEERAAADEAPAATRPAYPARPVLSSHPPVIDQPAAPWAATPDIAEGEEEAIGDAAGADEPEESPWGEPTTPAEPESEIPTEAIAEPPPVEAAPTPAPSARAERYVDLGSLFTDDEEEATESTRFRIREAPPSGDEDQDFAELLNRFKEKVAEHLPPEDAAAHYDLGLAFKEMGLIDEAIAEFQVALRTGHMRLKVYEELGYCFLYKEQYNIAEKVLRQALNVQYQHELELIGIYYQLGRAYEAMGRRDQARDAYERVLGMDLNFQDTSDRLARL